MVIYISQSYDIIKVYVVFHRARLTLPHFLQAIDLPSEEVGVFACETIAAKTQFGPYEAKKTTHEFNDDTLFVLKVIDNVNLYEMEHLEIK